MSGWAVFPYQHISPPWREVQLSILCTGSPDWGSDPKQDTLGALFPARAHLTAGTAFSYPIPAVPIPKATGNLPRTCRRCSGTTGTPMVVRGSSSLTTPASPEKLSALHSSRHSPARGILHNIYSWNSLSHCHQNTLKQAAIKRSTYLKVFFYILSN